MAPIWPVIYPEEPVPGAEKWEGLATELLSAMTGGVFGLCIERVRPCRSICTDGKTFDGTGPTTVVQDSAVPRMLVLGGLSTRCGVCSSPSACSCGEVPEIALPGPVHSVLSVVVDGIEVPQQSYRIDNRRWLVRQDGGLWPTCQDMALPAGEPHTWEVEYMRGVDVPEGGSIAAGVLAGEFAKAASGDPSCRLPQRVTSITRQGVTMALLDDFDGGRTGIWLIDAWVAAVRTPRRGGSVRSPDIPAVRSTTWRS